MHPLCDFIQFKNFCGAINYYVRLECNHKGTLHGIIDCSNETFKVEEKIYGIVKDFNSWSVPCFKNVCVSNFQKNLYLKSDYWGYSIYKKIISSNS